MFAAYLSERIIFFFFTKLWKTLNANCTNIYKGLLDIHPIITGRILQKISVSMSQD